MMGRSLLVVGWLGTALLLITAVLGFRLEGADSLAPHLLGGLVACLLVLFSHSWILFYLVGTGKAIKEAVAEHGLDAELVERTKQFKALSYPWLMTATLLTMAAFILGGGVATRVLPVWIHHGLFWIALAAQLRALAREHEALGGNERLLAEVRRLVAGG